MGKVWQWLSGPATSVINSVGGVIDDLTTSEEEKLTAQMALKRIEAEFQLAIMNADVEYAREQAKVLQTELSSGSWLGKNWRPILMLVFTFIILFNFVIAPIFSMTLLPIPGPMWELLKIGVGGYIVGRSAEKIIPATKLAKD